MDIKKIPLDDIRPWAGNPRTTENEGFAQLYSSLKKTGYEGVFLVTQEPSTDFYIPYRGGNTTVRIMKTLKDEGDERFTYVKCEVKEWPGLKVMQTKAHNENSARGDMSFTDNAVSLVSILQSHFGDDEQHLLASSTKLIEILASEGVKVNKRRLTVSIKFVQHIKDYFYNSTDKFNGGQLTLADAEQILKTKKTYEKLVEHWNEHVAHAPKTFQTILSELDGRGQAINDKLITQTVKSELAEWTQLNITEVSVAYHASSNGEQPEFPTTKALESPTSCETTLSKPQTENANAERDDPQQVESEILTPTEQSHQNLESKITVQPSQQTNSPLLTAEASEVAKSICEKAGIGECYRNTQSANGFFVELPKEPLLNADQSLNWWVLFVVSDVIGNKRLRESNPNSPICQAVNDQQLQTLYGQIGSKPISASKFNKAIRDDKAYQALMIAIWMGAESD